MARAPKKIPVTVEIPYKTYRKLQGLAKQETAQQKPREPFTVEDLVLDAIDHHLNDREAIHLRRALKRDV